MTLIEKLEALTPEQQKKFIDIATEQEFAIFLSETGAELAAEEKAAAWKYIQARQVKTDGKTELADEELENVAGGHGGLCHKGGREVVILLTECVHGLKVNKTSTRTDKWGDNCKISCCYAEYSDYKSATSNKCKYLLYEKGLWLCDYPEHLKK